MSDNKLDKALNKGIKSAKDALAEKMVHLAHKEAEQTPKEIAFNVIFTGVFTKDEKLVIAAMAKFFKQGQEATKRLLKPGRVIKSFPDKGPADKLAKMLSGIGLTCKVEMEVVSGGMDEEKGNLLTKAAFRLADSDVPEVHIPKFSEITRIQWTVFGLIFLVVIGGISWQLLKAPIVEGDSFASFETSIQTVIDKAPEEKRAALQKSIQLLTSASDAYKNRASFAGSERVAAGVVFARVDGLTAEEIIKIAEQDMAQQRQSFDAEIRAAKEQLSESQTQLNELQKSNLNLKQLSISDARFVWQSTAAPEMMLKLTNHSNITLTKIFFQGYLHNADGKLLVSEPFAYGTAVGIRPNDSKYVTISPAEDSPWAIHKERANWQTLKFSATVENALDKYGKEIGVDLRPNRKAILDDKERIKRLEQQLKEIKF